MNDNIDKDLAEKVSKYLGKYNYLTWENYEELSKDIKEHPDIVDLLIKGSYLCFQKLPEHIKNDKTIVYKLLKSHSQIFDFLTDDLKQDEDLVSHFVQHIPFAIGKLNKTFKDNKKIVLQALSKEASLYQQISNRLKNDWDIISLCVNNGNLYYNLGSLPENVLKDSFRFVSLNFKEFLMATSRENDNKNNYAKKYIYSQLTSPKNETFSYFLKKELSEKFFTYIKTLSENENNLNFSSLTLLLTSAIKHWSNDDIQMLKSKLNFAPIQDQKDFNQLEKVFENEIQRRVIQKISNNENKDNQKQKSKTRKISW
jgi:hypothetical protein